MSLINVSNLSFAYDGSYDNIFTNVSFQIDTDWKLGFTGRNGRGKTTFLNLLLGKYEYSGTISASVSFEYFPFEIEDKNEITIEAVKAIDPYLLDWKFIKELSMLELDAEVLYRPFKTLSNGEQTKVMLATLFLKENSFLLIDEPTNHLDIHGRQVVSEYLNKKSGFILVSHDRSFLDGCVDHILSINRANIEVQKGNYSSWEENKIRQDNYEKLENERLKKEISRLKHTAREKAKWSDISQSKRIGFDPTKTEKSLNRRPYEGAKAKKMMKRAKLIEKRSQEAIDEKSKLMKNLEKVDDLKINQTAFHSSRLVTLENISISYQDRQIFDNVSFNIVRGDRISLSGKNGCGKSSIIKLICGDDIKYTGNLFVAKGLKISYVSQDTSFLCGNLSEFVVKQGIDESLFKAILRKVDFKREQFEKKIEDFSGGQKKKVLIAKSLSEESNLLIWDEPLNFIDVLSREQIEKLILKCEPTILFVEHDKTFCDKIKTKEVFL